MKNPPEKIQKYLSKRSEKKWLSDVFMKDYNLVIVIPAIKEFDNLSKTLDSLAECEMPQCDVAVLVVINNSDKSNTEIKENNNRTAEYLTQARTEKIFPFDLNFIDAFSEGREIPRKTAGVGFARKIGMDQALLNLKYDNEVSGIVCLDADCTVEQNYLTEIFKYFRSNSNSSAVIKYEHDLENDAIICYEIFLRYYVLGLHYAGSPYAHHSIGSCVIIDPHTYVKIGGMNKKKAGEDFYFLEKAAKLKKVYQLNTTTVYPSARKSWRVPFGTGQRMNRYYERIKNEYVLDDPKVFIIMKRFLKDYFSPKSPDEILESALVNSPLLYKFLTEQEFLENLKKIEQNSASQDQLSFQKRIWFDGFKSMKLVHYLRENEYPERPMFNVLNEFYDLLGLKFDMHIENELPNRGKQIEYLKVLRSIT